MDKEVINVLIGAGISIVASAVTISINAFIQSRKDEQQQRRNIFLQRIDQLESFSKELVLFLSELEDKLDLNESNRSRDEDLAFLKIILDRTRGYQNQMGYYASVSQYLGGDVNDAFYQLHQNLRNMISFLGVVLEAVSKRKKETIDREQYLEKLEFMGNYIKLLQAFDKLKAYPPKL